MAGAKFDILGLHTIQTRKPIWPTCPRGYPWINSFFIQNFNDQRKGSLIQIRNIFMPVYTITTLYTSYWSFINHRIIRKFSSSVRSSSSGQWNLFFSLYEYSDVQRTWVDRPPHKHVTHPWTKWLKRSPLNDEKFVTKIFFLCCELYWSGGSIYVFL